MIGVIYGQFSGAVRGRHLFIYLFLDPCALLEKKTPFCIKLSGNDTTVLTHCYDEIAQSVFIFLDSFFREASLSPGNKQET